MAMRLHNLHTSGRGNRLERLWQSEFFNSLGMLYTAVTTHLGFKVFEEGTVMALAGAGGPTYVKKFREMIDLQPAGRFHISRDFISYDTHGLNRPFRPRFSEIFGAPRRREEPILDRHRDLAFALQTTIEETVLHVVRDLSKRHPVAQFVPGRRRRAQLRRKCAHPARHRLRVRLGSALRIGFRSPARQRVVALPSDAGTSRVSLR